MDYWITKEEYRERQEHVLSLIKEQGMDAICLFQPTPVFYLTGFAFIPTERPIALVVTTGESLLFVPRLEGEHAGAHAAVDRVVSYGEYPGEVHPMDQFKDLLVEFGIEDKVLAVDGNGYASSWGYDGPQLSEIISGRVKPIKKLLDNLRMIKSPHEIGLIRESAKWGNLAHKLLQEYSKPGFTENEISLRAGMEATHAMTRTLGQHFVPGGMGSETAAAGFRGQIGPNSAFPHAITINAVLKKGDTLVTGAGAKVSGYDSELERTMFVGEPSAEQRKYFAHMKQLQEVCFEAIKPGHECAEVDLAMRAYYEKHGLWSTWRHHVGHGLGLLGHEAPFLDIGDHTIIRPGMVFSVEPGIFVMGLGGFRHSDTIVVTETGIDMITYYPRDLESMICGC